MMTSTITSSTGTESGKSDRKKLKNQSLQEPLLEGMAMNDIYDSDSESLHSFQDNSKITSESNSQLSSRVVNRVTFSDRDSLLQETTAVRTPAFSIPRRRFSCHPSVMMHGHITKLLSKRVYANNAPKIFLETITAQT
jgi:hypothetical protein